MKAKDLYSAGKLAEAIDAQAEEVKRKPTDVEARGFLAELISLSGNVERAELQLDALARQAPESQMGASLFRQLLRAEAWRQDFHAKGRVPELIAPVSPYVRAQLEASIAVREGKEREATSALAAAEEIRPHARGRHADGEFEDFRDLDDLIAGVLEVLTSNGKYYWVPIDRVRSIEFRAPVRPRDLLWRRANVEVEDGPEGEVFLPSIYVAPAGALVDDALRLGRRTDWVGITSEPVRGVGLRTFLVGDEDRTILQLGELTFTAKD